MNRCFCLFLLLFIFTESRAQFNNQKLENDSPIWDRLFIGGGGSFGLGNFTFVEISPMVGYRFTDRASAGIGVTYRYTNNKNFFVDPISHDYGGSIFARYLVKNPFFIHTEYEYLNFEFPNTDPNSSNRIDFYSLLGGVGSAIPIGNRASLFALVLYNFSFGSTDPTPYQSPWILRGGITFGF